jgi:hypothetical protein
MQPCRDGPAVVYLVHYQEGTMNQEMIRQAWLGIRQREAMTAFYAALEGSEPSRKKAEDRFTRLVEEELGTQASKSSPVSSVYR